MFQRYVCWNIELQFQFASGIRAWRTERPGFAFQNVFAVIDLYGCVDAVTVISSAFTEVFNSCSRPPSIPSSDGNESLEVRHVCLFWFSEEMANLLSISDCIPQWSQVGDKTVLLVPSSKENFCKAFVAWVFLSRTNKTRTQQKLLTTSFTSTTARTFSWATTTWQPLGRPATTRASSCLTNRSAEIKCSEWVPCGSSYPHHVVCLRTARIRALVLQNARM